MAAGEGKRLHPLTKSIPKCLIPIDKTTILDRQIDILFKNRINDIIVVTGYKSNLIKKHIRTKNVRIIYNDKFERTDTLYSIYYATKYITGDFICLYGDLVFDGKIIFSLLKNKNKGSIVTSDPVRKSDSHSVIIENSLIKNINLKKSNKKINGQFIGISKFTNSYVDLFKNILDSFSKNNDLEGELVRVIESFIKQNIPIHAFPTKQLSWINVNDAGKLELAKQFFN